MNVWGRELSKSDVLKYCDIMPTKEVTLANGVKAILVTTGELCFTIVVDRGLDIADTTFCAIPITFNSKTGITPPNQNFLKGFFGGLLTTCGLTNVGDECVCDGKTYSQHGNLTRSQAYDVCVSSDWVCDELITTVSGKIKEASLFGENLVLHRKIATKYGENIINVYDRIENRSFEETPYMLLYHMNFGFPFFDKSTKLTVDTDDTSSVNSYSNVNEYDVFNSPQADYKEEVFAHKVKHNKAAARLENMGIYMQIESQNMPYLIEWKQIGEGDYALGLEPSTNKPQGLVKAKADNELKILKPMEEVHHGVIISFGKM